MMFNFLSQPVEKVLQSAAKFKREGKFDKAKSLLEKCAKEGPNNLQILTQLGAIYFETDQYKPACTTFKKAQRLFPSSESELLSLIESLHFGRGKPVESAELLLEIYAERKELDQGERVLSSLTEPQLHSIADRYEQMYKNSIKYKAGSLQRSLTLAYCLVGLRSAMHNYTEAFTMLNTILELSTSESETILKEAQRIATKEWGNPLLLILLADIYAKNGLAEKAAEIYMRAVESDSTKTAEVAKKIELLLEKLESEPLVKFLTQLTILDGQFEKALGLIGRMKKLGTTQEEIARLYNEVARLDPSSSQAHLFLGDHFFEEKRFDSAASEYVKAMELDDSKTDAVMSKLRNILSEDPANEYVIDITFDACVAQGDVHEAVKTLADAYRVNSGLSETIAEKLNGILEKDLSRADALILLGRIYVDRDDAQKAAYILSYVGLMNEENANSVLPLLKVLLGKNPSSVQVKIALADAQFGLRAFEKALDMYFETMDSNPNFVPAIIPRIDLLLREERSLAPRAAALYSEKKYLDSPVRHYARAEALGLAQKYSEAVEDLKACINTRPDWIDKCTEAYQRMIGENDNPEVRLAMADVNIRAGKFREAVEELNRAIFLDPKRLRDVLERLYKLKPAHDTPWMRKVIIDILIENRLHSQAVDEIRSTSEKFPSHRGPCHLALARVNQDRGLFGEVVPETTKAMEEDHSLAPAVIAVLEKQKQMDKANLSCLVALAHAYEFSAKHDQAVDELNKIADIYPEKTDWVIAQLQRISEHDPANARLSYLKGQLFLTKGEIERAIGGFSDACNLDPGYLDNIEKVYLSFLQDSPANPQVLLALARIKIEKTSFQEAAAILAQLRKREITLRGPVVRELRRIIEKDPQSTGAVRVLIELHTEEKKYDLCLDLLDELLYMNDGEIPWAMKYLKQIRDSEPNNSSCLRMMGYGYLKLGDLDESCQTYDSLIEIGGEQLSRALTNIKEMIGKHSDDSNVCFLYARMLSRNSVVEDACKLFRQLANADPSFEERIIGELELMSDLTSEAESPYLLLGELLERRGKYKNAIDTLSIGLKGAQHSENIMEFHILLANAYDALGNRRRARKELKLAKENVDSGEPFFRRLWELKQDRLDSEIAANRNELHRNPDDDLARVRLAGNLRRKGDIQKAIQVLRVPMKEPEARKKRAVELSCCLANQGEFLTGLEVLNSEAISCPPDKNDLEVLYTLAILYGRTGNPLSALACLKTIREVDPKYRETENLLKQEYKQLVLLGSGMIQRTLAGVLS